MKKKQRKILVLEDDQIEAMKISRVFNSISDNLGVVICKNGQEGLDWLEEHNSNLPGLIILDLNMPIMNGHEFLKIIKNDTKYKLIPVVVFTSSNYEQDKIDSYANYASSYITKPLHYNQYVEKIAVMKEYWNNCETVY